MVTKTCRTTKTKLSAVARNGNSVQLCACKHRIFIASVLRLSKEWLCMSLISFLILLHAIHTGNFRAYNSPCYLE